MKKQLKTLGAVALASLTAVGLASCKGEEPTKPNPDQGGQTVTPTPNPDQGGQQETPKLPALPQPDPNKEYKGATGKKNYTAASYAERTKILGVLEKYAVENNLTGITLYERGSFVKYDESVQLPTPTFVEGYGFGTITEGEIKGGVKNPAAPQWKDYFHTYVADEVATINMMNDKGSEVVDLINYVSSSYYDTRLNEFKDGYEWFGVLANGTRPEAVNPDSNGLATKYRIEVKTGNGFVYNTLSKKHPEYVNREVVLEDYITPYKMYYTQAYGMSRGSENLTGASSIKGSNEYYAASKNGFNQTEFDKLGVKGVSENGKDYVEIEFNYPCSPFYAMYYSSSPLFTPVPADFINKLGGGDFAKGMKVYGNKTTTDTQVDTFLSTGPYCIEKWDAQEIVFKKNPLYKLQGDQRYKIAGIHNKVLKAATKDELAGWKEFEAGNLSSIGIPRQMLAEHKNDKGVKAVKGGTTEKLNVNTLDQETWNKFFGTNGTVEKGTDNDWKCEPAMSNKDFVLALSSAINRKEYADKTGVLPSCDYFGSAYLSDAENGIVYAKTDEHKEAIKSLTDGADETGYSLEKAKLLFKKATDQLIAEGKYKEGDTITLDIVWQSKSGYDRTGKDLEAYWNKAFNESGSKLKLAYNNIIVELWSDVYYKHMMVGKFDLGLGSISGNPLNPINFLNTTFSTQETGFTLNWSVDTNTVDKTLFYDDAYWSYEALYAAADRGGEFKDGVEVRK